MITFDPGLLTGIQEIDAHHRELFARVDRLLEESRTPRGQDEVLRLLEFLARYVVDHFTAEESRMAAGSYGGLEVHVAEHRQFERELDAIRRQVRSEGPSPLLVARVGHRMTEWLRDHIYRTDLAMAEWLRRGSRA